VPIQSTRPSGRQHDRINATIDACIAHAHQAIETNLEDENGNEAGLFKDVTAALTALKITDEPEIKQGSVVKLNSGGKPMTVNKISKDIAEVIWFDGETNTFKDDRFATSMLRPLQTRPPQPTEDARVKLYNDQSDLRGMVGTVGTLGHIDPLSQNNSQSSECVDGDVGTAGTGTPAVGTRITASRVIIVTMLALAALALIAKLGGGFR
jgi:uncharacterized protein YodC (DUF2158 family)